MLTLAQTGKLERRMVILLYGSAYWKELINFEALVRHGVISPEDLGLFQFVDDPEKALRLLKEEIVLDIEAVSPAFAKSKTTRNALPDDGSERGTK